MSETDITAVWLTIQLALTTTLILFVLSLPLAWWLSCTKHIVKPVLEALITLPLVLPPTVLGFYLLILFSPNNPIGAFIVGITGQTLTFSFEGLVVASLIYSLPFMVQPLQLAFERLDREVLETAEVIGTKPLARFFSIALPLSSRGVLTACVLTFAHTVGEFGVVLMIGGNIPGETRVLSIAIYEHVETIAYGDAHVLAASLLAFCFCVLLVVYVVNRKYPVRVF